MFASPNLTIHLLRGAIGAAAFLTAYLGAAHTPVAWGVLAVAFVAWRGCPTCWAIGLYQTLHNRFSARRLERSCDDGRCRLQTAPPDAA